MKSAVTISADDHDHSHQPGDPAAHGTAAVPENVIEILIGFWFEVAVLAPAWILSGCSNRVAGAGDDLARLTPRR
jgi:hypothetical protein